MITVIYHRSRHELSVCGHAGHGAVGHDLVCASASILAYTLAAAVQNMADAGHVKRPKIVLLPGETLISCESPPQYRVPVTLVFDTVCGGFELLARDYPKNISYEIEGGTQWN